MIEHALRTALVEDGTVNGYVAGRVYYAHAPQDVATPYIVLVRVSGPREYSHDGATGLYRARFQFSIFATSYYEAKSIADGIRTVLSGASGQLVDDPTDTIGASFLDNEVDMYEAGSQAGDISLYHIAVDYLVWVNE